MIDPTQAKHVAVLLAAVGEPTRMMILRELLQGPSHVGKLADTVGVSMVNMSHHLGVMRQAGLLEDAKNGRQVTYSLRPDVFTPGANGDLGHLQFGSYRMTLLKPPPGPDVNGKKKPPAPKKRK